MKKENNENEAKMGPVPNFEESYLEEEGTETDASSICSNSFFEEFDEEKEDEKLWKKKERTAENKLERIASFINNFNTPPEELNQEEKEKIKELIDWLVNLVLKQRKKISHLEKDLEDKQTKTTKKYSFLSQLLGNKNEEDEKNIILFLQNLEYLLQKTEQLFSTEQNNSNKIVISRETWENSLKEWKDSLKKTKALEEIIKEINEEKEDLKQKNWQLEKIKENNSQAEEIKNKRVKELKEKNNELEEKLKKETNNANKITNLSKDEKITLFVVLVFPVFFALIGSLIFLFFSVRSIVRSFLENIVTYKQKK